VEGPVGAGGVAGGVEVLEQAADDGEHDSRQFGSAETAHAFLEGCEPVRRRGPPEAGPEWFSRRVVQPVEHAEVGLALRSGDRGRKGVMFLQEPAERPYGIEALFRDDSGNWFSLRQVPRS
jgi:hypothetical protein